MIYCKIKVLFSFYIIAAKDAKTTPSNASFPGNSFSQKDKSAEQRTVIAVLIGEHTEISIYFKITTSTIAETLELTASVIIVSIPRNLKLLKQLITEALFFKKQNNIQIEEKTTITRLVIKKYEFIFGINFIKVASFA